MSSLYHSMGMLAIRISRHLVLRSWTVWNRSQEMEGQQKRCAGTGQLIGYLVFGMLKDGVAVSSSWTSSTTYLLCNGGLLLSLHVQ